MSSASILSLLLWQLSNYSAHMRNSIKYTMISECEIKYGILKKNKHIINQTDNPVDTVM